MTQLLSFPNYPWQPALQTIHKIFCNTVQFNIDRVNTKCQSQGPRFSADVCFFSS